MMLLVRSLKSVATTLAGFSLTLKLTSRYTGISAHTPNELCTTNRRFLTTEKERGDGMRHRSLAQWDNHLALRARTARARMNRTVARGRAEEGKAQTRARCESVTVRGRRKREGRKEGNASRRPPPPQSVYNCLVWLRREKRRRAERRGESVPSRSPRNRVANLTGRARRFGHCQNENLAWSHAQYCNCLDYFATSERRVSHSSVRVRHVSYSYVVFMLANIYSLKANFILGLFSIESPCRRWRRRAG